MCLLLSSFSPLFLIGAVRAECPTLMYILASIGLMFTALLLIPVAGALQRAPRTFKINEVENASGEVAAYVATYILPLLIVGETRPRDFVAYALFLGLIGLIFIRGELLHYNPWIFLFGRSIFSIRIDTKRYYLITTMKPREGQQIDANLFADRFLITRNT